MPSRCLSVLVFVCAAGCVHLSSCHIELAESVVLDSLMSDYISRGGEGAVRVDASRSAVATVSAKYSGKLRIVQVSRGTPPEEDSYNVILSGVRESGGISVRVFDGSRILVYHLRRNASSFRIFDVEPLGIF